MKNRIRRIMTVLLTLTLMSADVGTIAESIIHTLTLPKALQIIEEEAFYGDTSIEKVVVPDGTTEIRSRAFAESSLAEIELPKSLSFISDDAFEGCSDFSIVAEEGSYAYDWAMKMGYIDDQPPTPVENFTVEELDDGTLSIIDYVGEETYVVIPDSIDGVKVTVIGESAFQSKGIVSVAIPEGIVEIGDYAFSWNWELECRTLPSTLRRLGEYAFNQCNLSKIELPEGLLTIGQGAFGGNTRVSTVQIPASVTNIGGSVFYDCDNMESITLDAGNTAYEIVDGVMLSRDGSTLLFWLPKKTDTEYIVPNGVREIAGHAFVWAEDLARITLPESLKTIGSSAFWGCSKLENFIIPNSCTTIGRNAFEFCEALTEIVLPEGLEMIDWATFSDCTNLERVVLPESVTWIDGVAFMGCTELKNINLPASIEYIGENVFDGCENLTVTVIKDSYAHKWCMENNVACLIEDAEPVPTPGPDDTDISSKYEYEIMNNEYVAITAYIGSDRKVVVPAFISGLPVQQLGDCAFMGKPVESVVLPAGITSIGAAAFHSCSALTDVTIPDGVTSIGRGAFLDCIGLTEVAIPDSVTGLGDIAFQGCSKLVRVTSSNGLPNVGLNMFRECSSLTDVTIRDGVTNIGESAFYGCGSLESLVIPESMTSIEASAFCLCSKLTEINLLENIKSISSNAFAACSNVTATVVENSYAHEWCESNHVKYKLKASVLPTAEPTAVPSDEAFFAIETVSDTQCKITKYIGNEADVRIPAYINGYAVTTIGQSAFSGIKSIASIRIPETVTTIDWYAFKGCTGLTEVIIPGTVKKMVGYAFENCTGLKRVTILEGVEEMTYAFRGCTGIEEISIPKSIVSGSAAFYGCTGLRSASFAEGMAEIPQYFFQNCSGLKEVTIPNGVRSIGSAAFYGCKSLQDIVLPETLVSIGSSAFYSCVKLENVRISDGLTTICNNAFYGCSSLNNIVIPDSVHTIEYMAFYNCSGLQNISVSANISVFGSNAFYGCNDMNMTVAEDSYAHKWCVANNIDFTLREPVDTPTVEPTATPVPTIEPTPIPTPTPTPTATPTATPTVEPLKIVSATPKYAWYVLGEASEWTIEITGGVAPYTLYYDVISEDDMWDDGTIDDPENATIWFAGEGENLLRFIAWDAEGRSSGYFEVELFVERRLYMDYALKDDDTYIITAFHGPEENMDVVIPAAIKGKPVTEIGEEAFYGFENVGSVSIPDCVTHIGDDAFFWCTGLKTVIWPKNLISIGNKAFACCESLTDAALPDNVQTIGDSAFLQCYDLKTVNWPQNLTSIGVDAFRACDSLAQAILPDGIQKIGEHAFYGAGISAAVIPDTVVSLGNRVFAGCENLTDVQFGRGIEDIPAGTFSHCTSLSNITLPDGLMSIGADAFYETAISTIELPVGLTELGEFAFYGTDLISITLPGSLEKVSNYAFLRCKQLRSVEMQEGIRSIGIQTFGECAELLEVCLPDTLVAIPAYAFAGCTGLKKIWIPESIKPQYDEEGNQTSFVPIASTAFNDVSTSTLTIHGVSGSYAETFAAEKGYTFVAEAFEYTPATLSGTVTDAAGSPLSGVTVTVYKGPTTNYPFSSTTTNSSGAWSVSNVKVGSYYGVGFEKEGYTFSPNITRFTVPDSGMVVSNVVGTLAGEPVSVLKLSVDTWNCSAESSIRAVTVNSEGDWEIVSKPDWITIYREGDVSAEPMMFAMLRAASVETGTNVKDNFLMVTEDNDDAAFRSDQVVVSNGVTETTITVVQSGKNTTLEDGGKYTILSPVNGADYAVGNEISVDIACESEASIIAYVYSSDDVVKQISAPLPYVSTMSLDAGEYVMVVTFYDKQGVVLKTVDGENASSTIQFEVKKTEDSFYGMIQDVVFGQSGGIQVIDFADDLTNIKIEEASGNAVPVWLSFEYPSFGKMKIAATEKNETGKDRTCTLKVTTGFGTKTIVVTQNASDSQPISLKHSQLSNFGYAYVGTDMLFGVLASGGAGNYIYKFDIYRDDVYFDTVSQSSNVLCYKVMEAGKYSVVCTVSDGKGKTATATPDPVEYRYQSMAFVNPDGDGQLYQKTSLPVVKWQSASMAIKFGIKITDQTTGKLLNSFGANGSYFDCGRKQQLDLRTYSSEFIQGHSYQIEVVGFDSDGTIVANSAVQMAIGTAQTIEILTPVNGDTLKDDALLISWDASGVEASLLQLRILDSNGKNIQYVKENATVLQMTDTQIEIPADAFEATGVYTIVLKAFTNLGGCVAEARVTLNVAEAADFSPIWPLKSNYQVSALYYYYNGGSPSAHDCYLTGSTTRYTAGMDVHASEGTSVLAVEGGTVVRAEKTNSNFGNIVIIDHGDGIYSMYAHLNSYLVTVGTDDNPTKVVKGQQIGTSGKDSDDVNGHLHFEIFTGSGAYSVSGGNAWLNYYRKKYMTSLKYDESVYLANNLKKDSDSLSKEVVEWLDAHYTKKDGVYEYNSDSVSATATMSSATIEPATGKAWTDQFVFKVVTSMNANFLQMVIENGDTREWTASGLVVDEANTQTRTWTIPYGTFSQAGSRNLSFRASDDGKTWSDEVGTSVTILPEKASVRDVTLEGQTEAGGSITLSFVTTADIPSVEIYACRPNGAGDYPEMTLVPARNGAEIVVNGVKTGDVVNITSNIVNEDMTTNYRYWKWVMTFTPNQFGFEEDDYLLSYKIVPVDADGQQQHYKTEDVTVMRTERPSNSEMVDNLVSSGVGGAKTEALRLIAEMLLAEGKEAEFVAGVCGNILCEASIGQFEHDWGSDIQWYLPSRLEGDPYNYKAIYGNKYIYNGYSLAQVSAMINELSEGGTHKFGLGCAQWTSYDRIKRLMSYYKAETNGADTITKAQCTSAEMKCLQYELNHISARKKAYTYWKRDHGMDLNALGARQAGYYFAVYYEGCNQKYYADRMAAAEKVYDAMMGSYSGGGSIGGDENSASIQVNNVSLNTKNVTLATGQKATLIATVLPSNAVDRSVNWSSTDSSVVAVDSNGMLTAKTEGTVTITAAAVDGSQKYDTCIVTVVNANENCHLSVSTDVWNPTYADASADLAVTCCESYSFETIVDESMYTEGYEKTKRWLSAEKLADGSLVMHALTNYGSASRVGSIRLTCSCGMSKTVEVIQAGGGHGAPTINSVIRTGDSLIVKDGDTMGGYLNNGTTSLQLKVQVADARGIYINIPTLESVPAYSKKIANGEECVHEWETVIPAGIDPGSYEVRVSVTDSDLSNDPYAITTTFAFFIQVVAPTYGANSMEDLEYLVSTGVVREKEYNNRVALLNAAKAMCEYQWTPSVSFSTWKGCTRTKIENEDGTTGYTYDFAYNSNKNMRVSGTASSNYYFEKGVIYKGIPYSANETSEAHHTAGINEWATRLKSNELSSFQGTARYLYTVDRTNCTIFGIDCSGFVWRTYQALSSYTYAYKNTTGLSTAPWFEKIDPAAARPGDIAVKAGKHTVVFAGRTDNGQVIVYESVADGKNGYSGCCYRNVNEAEYLNGYTFYRYVDITK